MELSSDDERRLFFSIVFVLFPRGDVFFFFLNTILTTGSNTLWPYKIRRFLFFLRIIWGSLSFGFVGGAS